MTRVLVAVMTTLVLVATQHALAVAFGVSAIVATPTVVVVAYAGLTLMALEAVVIAAACGVVADALTGMPLGLTSFSLVSALLVARLGLRLATDTRGLVGLAFVGVLGSLQCLVMGLLLSLFSGRASVSTVFDAAITGAADVVLAIVLFPLFRVVAMRAGLEERSATLRERLASRA